MTKSNVDPYWVCNLRVKVNSVLCLQCDNWIHRRCARMKMVTAMFSRNFASTKWEGNIGEAVEQEVKLCEEVETVCEFTYLGYMVCASGECEASVSTRTRCGWVKYRECDELLHGRRFPLKLKGSVYKSYIRPVILYGSEAWCLKESEIGI